MALTSCRECGHSISTTARSCPKCGAKVPRFKWWLWVPLTLVAAFIGFGFSIPEYKGRAMELRRTCEAMVSKGLGTQYQCDKMYEDAIQKGRSGSP